MQTAEDTNTSNVFQNLAYALSDALREEIPDESIIINIFEPNERRTCWSVSIWYESFQTTCSIIVIDFHQDVVCVHDYSGRADQYYQYESPTLINDLLKPFKAKE